MEWKRGDYLLTTDPARVDVEAVHAFLAGSYWARGIPFEVVQRSVEHSLNFSLWHEPQAATDAASAPGSSLGPATSAAQVGFARVITDYATFGYVGDVYVLEAHRGRGLSKWMMRTMIEHPDLQGFRRWSLLTRDAHDLYRPLGFTPLASPERWMERWLPDAYADRKK
ncbi:MAG: GNAT family N-acetyltransferase [Candidatus Eisenbacteria bacterium]|nr:GNAT family N-acetyltransferase [Candidatus Eisenbacteria bacterium]